MTITLHKHRWIMSRSFDDFELYDVTVWSFAPSIESQSTSEQTGIVHHRSASEAVLVVTPPFSYFDDGGRFWVASHKLGLGKEPERFPPEMVASMATKETRGFRWAKN
jgi:hypothetical protein